MIEFTAYMEIIFHGEKVDYCLNAGYDFSKKKYYMPSFSIYENYGLNSEKVKEVWDNDIYLFETLYKQVLVPWTENSSILSPESFADLIKVNGGSVTDIPGLKELFDKGIELHFFENIKHDTYRDK